MLRALTNELNPRGVLGVFLVESMAAAMTRTKRVRRLEAEYITGVLNPPSRKEDFVDEWVGQFSGTLVDPGLPAPMPLGSVQTLFQLFHRYGTGTEQQLYRLIREYERLEEKRRDHPDNHNGALISFTESPDTSVAPPSGSTDKPEEQKPLAAEDEAPGDPNIGVDAPNLASFADAPADAHGSESAPPEEKEEFKSMMLTEEAEAYAVDLNIDDNAQDSAPNVSPSEPEGLDRPVTGAPTESEDLSEGEPETAGINEQDR